MLRQTTDPVTGNDVASPGQTPFVIEGTGGSALKICFESGASRRA